MNDFEYKSVDTIGLDTLSVIEEANHFNHWMYSVIKPFLKGTVLEVGSGTGNISEYALRDGFDIALSDIRENYRGILARKFPNSRVLDLDIVAPDFEVRYRDLVGTFDSVFALNVVEHVKDDGLALRNCATLLKPKGNLIILVPAYQALYNEFDRQLEHYRRYTKKNLQRVFPSTLVAVHSQYFNLIGLAGWFFSGAVLKRTTIPGNQMKIYNALIRVLRYADNLIFHKAGLSVIHIAAKP